MLYLVELDHVKPSVPMTPEAGRTFIEQVIFPTLARADQLMAEGLIVGGGAVVGRVALRFVFEVESSEHLDRLVSTLPIWPVAETRETPLITVDERRQHVQTLLSTLTTR